jgi:LPS sulfotransferase NodH
MDREDKDAQAKSFAIAKHAKEWVLKKGSEGAQQPPAVSDEQIYRAREEIRAEWKRIRIFCEKTSVPIMYLTYEQVLQNPQNIVSNVVDFCNVDSSEEIDIDKVPIARQSQRPPVSFRKK